MHSSSFKAKNSLDQRKLIFKEFQARFTNKIPIIIETKSDLTLPFISLKISFKPLTPLYLITSTIRKKVNLAESEALFLFCNNTSLSNNMNIEEVYKRYQDEDGFLYIKLSTLDCYGDSIK